MKIFLPAIIAIMGWMVLTPVLYLLGSLISPWLRQERRSRILEGIYFMAFGLIFFLLYVIFVGSFGWFRALAILIFAISVLVLRASQAQAFWNWFSEMCRYPFGGKSVLDRAAQLIFLLSLSLTFVFCMLPEISNDALCYQLNTAKNFARQSSVWPQQYDLNSYMPLAMNYLYAVGLLFQSVPMAKLFHWWSAVLLAFAIACRIEEMTSNRKVALLCGLMFWLTPTVMNEVTTTYVDIATAFFVFLSLCLLIEGFQSLKRSPFFLSGLLIGAAIGVKLSMLLNLLIVGLFFIVMFWKSGARLQLLICGVYFLGGCFLISGYWFVRNYWLMGNPLFPYFGRWFGTIGLDNFGSYSKVGVPKTWINYILLPWNLTVHNEFFDKGFWPGPFYLLSIPVALFSFIREQVTRPYLIFTFLFATIWFYTSQATRYLLPAIPVWMVALGIGFARLKHWLGHPWAKRGFSAIVAGLTLFLFAITSYHYRFQFLPAFGIWDYDTYLTRMERTYPIAVWINDHLAKDAKIFNVEEIRQFYFERDTVREAQLNIFKPYWRQKSAVEVLKILKSEKFTHILRTEIEGASGALPDRLWWLDSVLQNKRLTRLIASIPSQNIRETRYRYFLYEILD